jgi:hypothetical protein
MGERHALDLYRTKKDIAILALLSVQETEHDVSASRIAANPDLF